MMDYRTRYPADIWDAAREVAEYFQEDIPIPDICIDHIAGALIAERERCARIAEAEVEKASDGDLFLFGWEKCAEKLVEAIRARAPPSPSQQGERT